MKNSFKEFETQVRHLCNPVDFEKNNEMLKELKGSSYETFMMLLKLGGEIKPSIRASEEIFKISTGLPITEIEIVELTTRFRLINGLLDERGYLLNHY